MRPAVALYVRLFLILLVATRCDHRLLAQSTDDGGLLAQSTDDGLVSAYVSIHGAEAVPRIADIGGAVIAITGSEYRAYTESQALHVRVGLHHESSGVPGTAADPDGSQHVGGTSPPGGGDV